MITVRSPPVSNSRYCTEITSTTGSVVVAVVVVVVVAWRDLTGSSAAAATTTVAVALSDAVALAAGVGGAGNATPVSVKQKLPPMPVLRAMSLSSHVWSRDMTKVISVGEHEHIVAAAVVFVALSWASQDRAIEESRTAARDETVLTDFIIYFGLFYLVL